MRCFQMIVTLEMFEIRLKTFTVLVIIFLLKNENVSEEKRESW